MGNRLINQWVELPDGWLVSVQHPPEQHAQSIRICQQTDNGLFEYSFMNRDFIQTKQIHFNEIVTPILTMNRTETHRQSNLYSALMTALYIAGIRPATTVVETERETKGFSESAWIKSLEVKDGIL